MAENEAEPSKYWLLTLPGDTALGALVDIAKLRWRIERDDEELKSELGLGHFEGRGWRGFHHHATLCIGTYGFLIREASGDSPLRRLLARKTSPFQPLRTARLPRSGPNATSRTPSRQFAKCSPSLWPNHSSVARVANARHPETKILPSLGRSRTNFTESESRMDCHRGIGYAGRFTFEHVGLRWITQ